MLSNPSFNVLPSMRMKPCTRPNGWSRVNPVPWSPTSISSATRWVAALTKPCGRLAVRVPARCFGLTLGVALKRYATAATIESTNTAETARVRTPGLTTSPVATDRPAAIGAQTGVRNAKGAQTDCRRRTGDSVEGARPPPRHSSPAEGLATSRVQDLSGWPTWLGGLGRADVRSSLPAKR